jgi:amino acid transporter
VAGAPERTTTSKSAPVDAPAHVRTGRRLGPFLCWAVVFADIGTSVYYTPGILYQQVGVHAALFVTMTLVVFVLLCVKYAEVAIRYPGGGGVVTVATRAIHPYAGLVGGLLILVDYFLTAALSALSGVIYLTVFAGALKPLVLAAAVAALILLGLLNLMGVKTSAQVTAVFATVAAAGQLAVVAGVAVHLGFSGVLTSLSHLLSGSRLGPLQVLTGFSGAFLAFSGLESIAQLAPAMAEPRRRVAPIAMGLVVVTVTVTSPLLTLWSTTLLDPATNDPNQFVSLLGGFAVGPVLQVSVALSAALLLVFASNTALIGTYNVFLALARMRFLPGALTKTNRWRKTPHWAILVATAVPVGVVVFSGGNVGLLGDLYAFGLLGAFSVTCIALDLVRFHERHVQRLGHEAVNVGRVRFILGVITTFLVTGAWITNLFAKPLATLFGGCVTIVGIGIAFVTYRRARRRGPSVIFPHIYHHQQPIVFMSKGRRLPAARVLALLPHDANQAEQLAELVAADTSGRPVAFVYIAHPDTARKKTPQIFEIVDPYRDDVTAQEVVARAEAAGRTARIDSRFIYVPAGAAEGTVEWLVSHLAPQETVMLDDGAGLAASDKFTLERRRAGDTPVLHYRAKPD